MRESLNILPTIEGEVISHTELYFEMNDTKYRPYIHLDFLPPSINNFLDSYIFQTG